MDSACIVRAMNDDGQSIYRASVFASVLYALNVIHSRSEWTLDGEHSGIHKSSVNLKVPSNISRPNI